MTSPIDPRRRLKRIAADTMLIGIVLAGVGAFVVFIATQSRFASYWPVVGSIFILLIPGAWFVYAGSTIRNANLPVVKWSMAVAIGQLAACFLSLLVTFTVNSQPAFAACGLLFFLPAQLVLLFQLWQARDLIMAEEAARGFAIGEVMTALPSEATDEPVGEAELIPEATIAPPEI